MSKIMSSDKVNTIISGTEKKHEKAWGYENSWSITGSGKERWQTCKLVSNPGGPTGIFKKGNDTIRLTF